VTVDTSTGLAACLAELEALEPDVLVALDSEATGLDPWTSTPLLLQLTLPTREGEHVGDNVSDNVSDNVGATTFVIVLPAFAAADLAPLFAALCKRTLLGHNLDYDLRLLGQRYQLAVERVYDTLLAEAMLTTGDFDDKGRWLKHLSLAQLAERYLSLALDKATRETFIAAAAGGGAQWRPTPSQVAYAAADVQILHAIRQQQMARLEAEGLIAATDLRMAALPAIVAMELTGVRVDANAWRAWLRQQEDIKQTAEATLQAAFAPSERAHQEAVAKEALRAREQWERELSAQRPDDRAAWRKAHPKPNAPKSIPEKVTINLASTPQVRRALESLGLKVPSINKETLERVVNDPRISDHQRKVVAALQRYRVAEHAIRNVGENILALIRPETGRLHSHFNIQAAETGRMSSERPSFQNLPSDPALRAAFVADPGCLVVTADYRSEELAVSAALSGDPALRQAICEGRDLYRELAATVYGVSAEDVTSEQRKHGKAALLGISYGQTAKGLERVHRIPQAEGERLLAAIRQTYPALCQWSDAQVTQARARGWAQSATGAKRYFHNPELEGWKLATEARNAPVQGTAADIVYRVIARLHQALTTRGDGSYLANVIHDELVVVCPEAAAASVASLVEQEMQAAFEDVLPEAQYRVRCGSGTCLRSGPLAVSDAAHSPQRRSRSRLDAHLVGRGARARGGAPARDQGALWSRSGRLCSRHPVWRRLRRLLSLGVAAGQRLRQP
jgi:DNA polymerase I-like protein with 3'-5' exonuclease and polymerase domains